MGHHLFDSTQTPNGLEQNYQFEQIPPNLLPQLEPSSLEKVLAKKSGCAPVGFPEHGSAPSNQKRHYSGKQKCHTVKSQIIVDAKTNEIICTAVSKSKEHDFRIWKESQIGISKKIELLADKGYQGIKKLHENSRISFKKTKGKSLSQEQKKFNLQLVKERIVVEHVHRRLKIFRILSSRYINRRKRFGLRLNLIAGIYNYELHLSSKYAIV